MSTSNTSIASYAASVVLFIKGLFTSIAAQLSALGFESKVGLLLGLSTFIINWYYQRRRDQREERLLSRQAGAANKHLLPLVAAGMLLAVGTVHTVTDRQHAFTGQFEGLRLTAYPDPAAPQILTVCRGITNAAAPGWVVAGKTYTPDECFNKETELMQTLFAPAIAHLVKVPTTQQQREMLGDFAWNKGITALERSTLLRKLNAGDCHGAADEFDRWVWAGGRRWAGLARRMDAAQANFRQGCPT